MKDIELRARLLRLGMTSAKADEVTRTLRDVIHPVAVTAAAKMQEHHEALGAYGAYGTAGLSGYETDELSGLLKSVKKAVKKVAKTVTHPVATTKKVVKGLASVAGKIAPIAAFVPGIGTAIAAGATAIAIGGGALKKSDNKKLMKSGKAVGGVAYNTMSPQQLNDEAARLQTMIAAGKDKKDAGKKLANVQAFLSAAGLPAAPPPQELPAGTTAPVVGDTTASTVSRRLGLRGKARVPKALADMGGKVAADAVQQGYAADPAALMQAMLSSQGTNMVSPAAQSVIHEVAAQGVEATPAGPSALPPWMIPAGIGAGALILILGMKGKK